MAQLAGVVGSMVDPMLEEWSNGGGGGGWVFDPVRRELLSGVAATLAADGSDRSLLVSLRIQRWLTWQVDAERREREACDVLGIDPAPVFMTPGAIALRAGVGIVELPPVETFTSMVVVGLHRGDLHHLDRGVPPADPGSQSTPGRPWCWAWERPTCRLPLGPGGSTWGLPVVYPSDWSDEPRLDAYAGEGWAVDRVDGEVLVIDAGRVRDVWFRDEADRQTRPWRVRAALGATA